MSNFFSHFKLITHHRHLVIKNARHLGIFWYSLHHDLSKYSWKEFHYSYPYFQGNRSPIPLERKDHDGYSKVFNHHYQHNKHHYEHYMDFHRGELVISPMPYKDTLEFLADMIAASMTYNEGHYEPNMPLAYLEKTKPFSFMHDATYEFLHECLTIYQNQGFKALKKKVTKKIYVDSLLHYPKMNHYILQKKEREDNE